MHQGVRAITVFLPDGCVIFDWSTYGSQDSCNLQSHCSWLRIGDDRFCKGHRRKRGGLRRIDRRYRSALASDV
jgi:hypothetical protein